MVGIYTITSPTNNVYVGQSHNVRKRITSYKRLCCKGQPRIYNSLMKYGADAHKFEVIMELRKDISQGWMNYWETFFWQYYKENGVEMLNTKIPGSSGKHSKETKQKLSFIAKQRLAIPENNPNYGKKASPELLRKLSLSHIGKKLSEETKKKMRGTRAKIVHWRNHKVVQYDLQGNFIKEWVSLSQAQKETGVSYQGISHCCRIPSRKSAGGYVWKYKEGTL